VTGEGTTGASGIPPARWRLIGLGALVVPALLALLAGSQDWEAAAAVSDPDAGTSGAAGAVTALAIAGIAAAAAQLLAGAVFRRILAVLSGLLGVAVLVVGIVGAGRSDATAWPAAAIVAGALAIAAAVLVLASASRWPRATTRYSRTRATGDPASDWDALSEGEDPTDATGEPPAGR